MFLCERHAYTGSSGGGGVYLGGWHRMEARCTLFLGYMGCNGKRVRYVKQNGKPRTAALLTSDHWRCAVYSVGGSRYSGT